MTDQIEMIKDVAAHDVEIKHLQDDMERMIKEMTEIKKTLNAIDRTLSEAKGGWKTLVVVGSVASSIGAAVAWIANHFWK